MFRTKTRKEQLTERLVDEQEALASTAATVAEQLRERVVPAVGQATVNAREWARPHVEHGIEVAAPRLESAVNGLAPKVDTARDKIVDELIPRIAEAISVWAAASIAARDEAVSRGQGAASVLSGDAVAAPRGRRKKRVLLGLGLLTAAAAAAMTFMKKSAPKDDPWTTPLADQYGAASNGRPGGSLFDETTASGKTGAAQMPSEITDPPEEKSVPSPMDVVKEAGLTAGDTTGNGETRGGGTRKNGAHKSSPGNTDTTTSGAESNGADKDPNP
jgi:hypothetical protein